MFLKRVAATGAVFAIIAAPIVAHATSTYGSAGTQTRSTVHHGVVAARTTYPAGTINLVQRKLDQLGYHAGKPDGKWGPRTAAAVKAYQGATGLQPTGRLNNKTLAALGLKTGRRLSGAKPMNGLQGKSRGGYMHPGVSMGSPSKGSKFSYGKPLGGGSKMNQ